MSSPALEWYFNKRFPTSGYFEMPRIERQVISLDDLKLIRFSSVIRNETKDHDATVHFFEPDDRFDEVWKNPEHYLLELGQYKQVMSPDFSLYWNTPMSEQVINTYRSRWCGRFWQEHGMTVIPTVSWSRVRSYEFCFDGLPYESTLAVSTVGTRDSESDFMAGYRYMCKKLRPTNVICYGLPFQAMMDIAPLVVVPYSINTRTINRLP
jgi:hypothetical protein